MSSHNSKIDEKYTYVPNDWKKLVGDLLAVDNQNRE
jgi:hypothetical protein